MTQWKKNDNQLIKIMLDLADIADKKQETPFEEEMGLGYKVFSEYVRGGVKEIIELKSNFYEALDCIDHARNNLRYNEAVLEKIFGRIDLNVYNDNDIARFKALADQIEKEKYSEVSEDND